MDYILFIRVPGQLTLKPEPDEVRDTKWVTQQQLDDMMAPGSGLKWSPWFRIIATHFLRGWWADLDGALAGRHADWGTVHHLEC